MLHRTSYLSGPASPSLDVFARLPASPQEAAFGRRRERTPGGRGGRADSRQPRPQASAVFSQSTCQKRFRRSSTFHSNQNRQRAAARHFRGCRIRGRPPANLLACMPPLALRSAQPGRTDARRIKLCATVRLPGNPARCAAFLLLRVSAAVRVRIRPAETRLPAPVHSPIREAAPQIPKGRRTQFRWCPLQHSKKGPPPRGANLPRSGGSDALLFPYVPRWRSFRRVPERDAPRWRFRNGRTVRRETWESSALLRE